MSQINNISYDRSFASHPTAEYWSEINDKQPEEVYKSSGMKYFFDCIECYHTYPMILSNASKGAGCPYCSGHRLCTTINCNLCFEKSFASYPKSKFWSNNNNCKPRDVFKFSKKNYWFDCTRCSHEFQISLANISKGSFCSFCSNKRLCDDDFCEMCFEKSLASHRIAKYWSKENNASPREIFKCSNKKYKFDCNKCNHTFEAIINNIINYKNICPFCCDPPKKLCDNSECESCFNKSFASHNKVAMWSSQNKTLPINVFKSARKKYKFDCDKCHHTFECNPSHMTNGDCPFCCYSAKKLCSNNKCELCFEKSFASHPKSYLWSSQNKISPRNVFKSTDKK